MPHTLDPLTVIMTILFVARVTRLIVADQILSPIRDRLVGPSLARVVSGERDQLGWFAYLLTCAWCTSVWVAAGTLTAAYWWADTRWWFIMVTAGAASYVTGVAAAWLDPADD